jgi:hypothetical protein
MTLLLNLLAATSEEHHPIFMPPLAFGAVAFAVFLVLGVTTWSFRDVANRHSQKFSKGATDDHHAGH